MRFAPEPHDVTRPEPGAGLNLCLSPLGNDTSSLLSALDKREREAELWHPEAFHPSIMHSAYQRLMSVCVVEKTRMHSAAYYVSWSAIDQALSQYVTLYEDKRGD